MCITRQLFFLSFPFYSFFVSFMSCFALHPFSSHLPSVPAISPPKQNKVKFKRKKERKLEAVEQ